MKARDYCTDCGRTEIEHHAFRPAMGPASCTCHPSEWRVDVIPPVCPAFRGPTSENCLECEHNQECHV